LLKHLLEDKVEYSKVLVFVGTKAHADFLFDLLNSESEISVIHSGKEQNHRTKSIERFATGTSRILIATDVIARGIDIEKITAVISFNTPLYPENYIHRIGRTGRANQQGRSILFYTKKELVLKGAIEDLMNYTIPLGEIPEAVEVSHQLIDDEKEKPIEEVKLSDKASLSESGASFHEKSAKNSKVKTKKKSYNKTLKEKFKKPIRRGDKIQNMNKKKRK
jgi:ATP-dependent RNA helicase RhlE